MVATVDDIADKTGVGGLPLVPSNPLPIRQQLTALRVFHTGQETLRDAGGPVTRLSFGPKWLLPPIVLATTPQGARDIPGRPAALVERNKVHQEMRQLVGPNLFVITHDAWLRRRRALQPVFTKHRVRSIGGQMSEAADAIANSWADGGEIDLDTAPANPHQREPRRR